MFGGGFKAFLRIPEDRPGGVTGYADVFRANNNLYTILSLCYNMSLIIKWKQKSIQ